MSTNVTNNRLERKFSEASRWMKKANKLYKEGMNPGFSRTLAENRLNEYFDEIDRELGRL